MEEPKILNVHQRIHAVMAELDYIQKDPKKAGLQFSYASHDKVTAAVREVCVKHGLICIPSIEAFNQDGNRTEVLLSTSLINIDDPSDREVIRSIGYGVDPQDKGPGKGVSYAFKYALLKAFMLETGDDPDAGQGPEFNHKSGPARTGAPAAGGSIPLSNTEKPLDKFNRLLSEAEKIDKTRNATWLRTKMKEDGVITTSPGITWLEDYIKKAQNASEPV